MIRLELTIIRVRWTVEQGTFWILGHILSTSIFNNFMEPRKKWLVWRLVMFNWIFAISMEQSKEALLYEFSSLKKLISSPKLLDGHIIFSGLFHSILRYMILHPYGGAIDDIL